MNNVLYILFMLDFLAFRTYLYNQLRTSVFIYDAIHVLVLLRWCYMNSRKLEKVTLSNKLPVGLYITSQLLLLCFMLSLMVKAQLRGLITRYDYKILTVVALYVENVSFGVLLRLQLIAMYTLVGATIENASEEIERLMLEGGDLRSLCCEASRICAEITSTVSWVLRMFYLEYAIRLITEIPLSWPGMKCDWNWFLLSNVIFNLNAMLFLVSGGEALHRSILKIRRIVRHSLLAGEQRELSTFLLMDHGVRLTAKTAVSWETFADFLGICWGFTFMVIQWIIVEYQDCSSYSGL